ncbi:MAG: Capsule biosynthesis protein CapA [Myxococcota bacterium]|nr:Capsule biosynthesis protein CapA [Myxococcota bacterium]
MLVLSAVALWGASAFASDSATGTLSIAATGDVTLGHRFAEYVDSLRARSEPAEVISSFAFEGVRDVLRMADVAVINLEGPLTDRGVPAAKNFAFRAPPAFVSYLTEAGVDAALLGNNHTADYGRESVEDTRGALHRAGIAHCGAGMNLRQAREPCIMKGRGITLALLSYLYLGPKPPEPGVIWALEDRVGMAGHPHDEAAVAAMLKEDIAGALKTSDGVVVFMHWGRESTWFPADYQKRLARVAIDAGAAAVIGHHPHVLQGAETYRDRPIAYSLGNFVFGGNWNPRDKDAAIAWLELSRATGGKRRLSARLELLPVRTDRLPEGHPFAAHVVEGGEKTRVLCRLRAMSAKFRSPLPQLRAPDLARDCAGVGPAPPPAPATSAGKMSP